MLWSKATPTDDARSFDAHVHAHLTELEQNIGLLLEPIVQELAPLHDERRMHGGIHPAALRYSLEGELDRDHFKAQIREAGSLPHPQVFHAYLPPETLDGSGEDSRSDCYALGALLFQIIVGQPPAPAARRISKNDALRPEDYPQWPAPLLKAVNRCLVLDKGQRVATVRELWQALSAAVDEPASVKSEPDQGTSLPSPTTDSTAAPSTPDEPKQDTDSPVTDAVPMPTITISSSAQLRPSETITPLAAKVELAAPAQPLPTEAPATAVPPAPSFPSKIQIRERLANASVGKPYRQSIRAVFGDQSNRIASIALTVPEETGLAFDEKEEILHGTPKTAGELKLQLAFHLADSATGRSPLPQVLALTINPDPSSLWKNLDSDPSGLFAKPDEAKDFKVTPHLSTLAASLRGRSHAHEGKYRDDDFAMCFVEKTDWHIFIAADGAGSAKLSRRGSQIACQTAIAELENKLSAPNELEDALQKLGGSNDEGDVEKLRKFAYNILSAVAHQALKAIDRQASEQQAALRDFSTTFIVVLAKKLKTKWFLTSFAIGDGGAGAMLNAERVKLLTQPDSGEFAGQTVFLTTPQVFNDSDALLARTHAAFCDEFKFLAVMTDGITDPIFQSDAKFASAATWEDWRQLLSKAVDLDKPESGMEQALLEYLHFPSPGNHDDRTLILAVPHPSPPQP